jgi:hypothetical protein
MSLSMIQKRVRPEGGDPIVRKGMLGTTKLGGQMIRIMTAAILAGAMALPATSLAQSAAPTGGVAKAVRPISARPVATELSAQRRRPPVRVRIYQSNVWPADVYPRYDPGPNAVRVCNASYVQEYRPSGTVIVPHMHCVWRR